MKRHLSKARILLLSALVFVPCSAASLDAADRTTAYRQRNTVGKRQARAERAKPEPAKRDSKQVSDTRSSSKQKVKAEKPRKQKQPAAKPDVAKPDRKRPEARPAKVPVAARPKQSKTASPPNPKAVSRQSDQKRAREQDRKPPRVRTQKPREIRQNRPEPTRKETPREIARPTRSRDTARPTDRNVPRHQVTKPGAPEHRRRSATERHEDRPDGNKNRSNDHLKNTRRAAQDHTNKNHGSGDDHKARTHHRDGGVVRHHGTFRDRRPDQHRRPAVVRLRGRGHYQRPPHRRYDGHHPPRRRGFSLWLYTTVFVYRPWPVIVESPVIIQAPATVSVKPNDVYVSTQNRLMDQVLHEQVEQRITAARELGEYRNASSVAVLIDVLVNDADATVRVEAANSLGKIGDPAAYEVLLRIAEADMDADVRDTAEHSTRKIEEQIDTELLHVSDVFPPMNQGDEQLGEYLEDLRFGSSLIRQAAAERLVAHRGTQAVAALINVLINDYDADVRLAAAQSLGEMGDRIALPFLALAAEHDESPSVRQEAEEAIEQINDELRSKNTSHSQGGEVHGSVLRLVADLGLEAIQFLGQLAHGIDIRRIGVDVEEFARVLLEIEQFPLRLDRPVHRPA